MDLEDISSAIRCKLLQPTKYAKCQSNTPNGGWSNPAGFPSGQAPSGYDYWAKALCDETGNSERLCELNICHGFEQNICTPPDCKGCGYTICGKDLKTALLKHLGESDSNTAPQSNDLNKPEVVSPPKGNVNPVQLHAFFSALKRLAQPPQVDPCDFTFEYTPKKSVLTWDYFRNQISSASYDAKYKPKVQQKICALLLIALYGLKPSDILSLRWSDFNLKSFTFRSGSFLTTGLTKIVVKLLYSLRETKYTNWKDTSNVFDFGERTLERAVKELIDEEFNPRDVAALEPIAPQGASSSQGGFALAQAVDSLSSPNNREFDDEDTEGIRNDESQYYAMRECSTKKYPGTDKGD
jgi:hypothetical protein